MSAIEWLIKELEYFREYEEFYTKRYQQIDALVNEAKHKEHEENKRCWIEGAKSGFNSSRNPNPSGTPG